MPPKPAISMSSEQIQLIKNWMSQGALNTDCNVVCDSRNISFSKDIFPLLQTNCIGCHQPANDQDGVNLNSYAQIIFYANNGDLLGCIKHDNLYKPMPELANKLTDCQIAQIENWIDAGAKND